MIDKLEVGIKYKLIDEDGFFKSNSRNQEIFNEYKDKNGCLFISKVSDDGRDGYSDVGDIIIISEELVFFEVYQSPTITGESEYRVIRKATNHQVCDWRKGNKLYEDEFGTLVRNDKRTKFYTDIVEWREAVIPVAPTVIVDLVSQLDTLSKPELEDLLIRLLDMTTATINNKDK
jgi:hypothetical protein